MAAASDIKFALDSIISVYEKLNTGADINVTYGSSGKFFEQIQQDAPFDMFFSADLDYPKKLLQSGRAISEPQLYGIGRIVVCSKSIQVSNEGIKALLNPAVYKIAIANPAHAPYGKRAVECLQHFKIYEKVKDKLVLGDNISQTAQFITTGAADIGIIALSLALSPAMQREGIMFYLIPENAHAKLEQSFVILKNARDNKTAKSFAEFMKTKEAIAVLKYFGFSQN